MSEESCVLESTIVSGNDVPASVGMRLALGSGTPGLEGLCCWRGLGWLVSFLSPGLVLLFSSKDVSPFVYLLYSRLSFSETCELAMNSIKRNGPMNPTTCDEYGFPE